MNLLDLNNDVLNIIGDYIKWKNEKEEIFERFDQWVNYLKNKISLGRDKMYSLFYYKLHECDNDEIDEYIKRSGLKDF